MGFVFEWHWCAPRHCVGSYVFFSSNKCLYYYQIKITPCCQLKNCWKSFSLFSHIKSHLLLFNEYQYSTWCVVEGKVVFFFYCLYNRIALVLLLVLWIYHTALSIYITITYRLLNSSSMQYLLLSPETVDLWNTNEKSELHEKVKDVCTFNQKKRNSSTPATTNPR